MSSRIRRSLDEYIDVDAAANEATMVAVLPIITTILWTGFLAADSQSPYLLPLLMMVTLAFSALYFRVGDRGLLTRILIDAAVMSGTIVYGKTTNLLQGSPSPNSSTLNSFIGLMCIFATVRSLEFILSAGEKFVHRNNNRLDTQI